MCQPLLDAQVCSAFTHVTACTLVGSPEVIRCIEGFSHFVTSMTAPTTCGWSILAGWDLHPLESAAFHGAHPLPPVIKVRFRGTR